MKYAFDTHINCERLLNDCQINRLVSLHGYACMIKQPISILLENSQYIIQSFKPNRHANVDSLDFGPPRDAMLYPLPAFPSLFLAGVRSLPAAQLFLASLCK